MLHAAMIQMQLAITQAAQLSWRLGQTKFINCAHVNARIAMQITKQLLHNAMTKKILQIVAESRTDEHTSQIFQ